VDFFLLDCKSAAVQMTSQAPTHHTSARVAVSEGRSNYLPSVHLPHKKHQFFHYEREVHEQILDFLYFDTDCSKDSPLHKKKTRPQQEKTVTVDQLLHHVQIKETNY
jgi:hypothetical protein